MTNKCPECGIEIDDHPAGRCLDWWIDRDVFGSKVLGFELWKERNRNKKYYSHFIDAAWEVVEKFRGDPLSHRTATSFVNAIADTTDANQDDFMADVYNLIMGLNPLTICRAAIKAVAKER